MRFSIITPSFRHSAWLKLCIASVADQDIPHEHIVQDACSDDGTQDWLPHDPRVTAVIEKDQGMYDAVNRGLRRAQGDLVAYLNCDEQYLPGSLRRVSAYFDQHPEVDVVFGDCVVVGPRGEYLCERRTLKPQLLHTRVSRNLSFLTAATFLRRRIFSERQIWFDPRLRAIGDCEWGARIIQSGVRMAELGAFTSSFTETGHNLMLDARSQAEARAFHAQAPRWARALAPEVVIHYRLRRWWAGHYRPQKFTYSLYTLDSPDTRQTFQVAWPTARWNRPGLRPAAK
jgi:glycosyltransferase involved in cell wall biosynthesis